MGLKDRVEARCSQHRMGLECPPRHRHVDLCMCTRTTQYPAPPATTRGPLSPSPRLGARWWTPRAHSPPPRLGARGWTLAALSLPPRLGARGWTPGAPSPPPCLGGGKMVNPRSTQFPSTIFQAAWDAMCNPCTTHGTALSTSQTDLGFHGMVLDNRPPNSSPRLGERGSVTSPTLSYAEPLEGFPDLVDIISCAFAGQPSSATLDELCNRSFGFLVY